MGGGAVCGWLRAGAAPGGGRLVARLGPTAEGPQQGVAEQARQARRHHPQTAPPEPPAERGVREAPALLGI